MLKYLMMVAFSFASGWLVGELSGEWGYGLERMLIVAGIGAVWGSFITIYFIERLGEIE